MIPSDHFVKFYNEVFKFLESQSEKDLRDFWMEISRHQESFLIDTFREKGLLGMKEYWDDIIFEENLDATTDITEEYFELKNNYCPSLAKAQDNDAGQMGRYCDHCAGWVKPIMDKLGYSCVSDMIDRSKSKCMMRVYKSSDRADAYRQQCSLPANPYSEEGEGR